MLPRFGSGNYNVLRFVVQDLCSLGGFIGGVIVIIGCQHTGSYWVLHHVRQFGVPVEE